jgi:hypothetical protein
VHAVVRRVASDDQAYIWYVQDRGAVGVSVPDGDGDQLMAFELEGRPVQRFGHGVVIRDLAGEPGLPECLEYPR